MASRSVPTIVAMILAVACGSSSSGGSGGGDGGTDGGPGTQGDGSTAAEGGTGSSTSSSSGGTVTPGACASYCIPSTYCSGSTCNPPSQCMTDAECPATDKQYSSNGPRCLSMCGDHRRCRKPCTTDDDCKPWPTSTANTCSGLADDGTRYCEIALTACPTGVCPQYTTCWPSFRPAN